MQPDETGFEASDKISRRNFVVTSMAALSAASFTFLPVPSHGKALENKITVQDIIDLILKAIPTAPYRQTVDTLKAGSNTQIVTGIVTTMFATIPVIQKAIKLKANFIIVHEPTFYNHTDDTSWLAQDDVYRFKKDLLEKNKIAVWRCHDYLHSKKLDGVQKGVLDSLGWSAYYNAENPGIITIPAVGLQAIIQHVKSRLGIESLRIIGDLKQTCKKIALLPGAVGGKGQIQAISREQPDLLIVGELQEWETSEYVRDARAMGKNISLVVLGHSASEEPGLNWLKEWLAPHLRDINITHVPAQNPFTWI